MKIEFSLFILVALSLAGCISPKKSVCYKTVVAPVLSATGPKTATTYQPAIFTLSYEFKSSCGKFNSISDAGGPAQPTTHLVTVAVDYDDCNCPQTIIPAQTTYTFVPTQAGTYYFKFVTASGYQTDTLVVK